MRYSLSQTLMTAWIALNSTVRFLLELCALLALMYWGIHSGDSMAEGIIIGALAPGAAIFVWWKLVAPKSASWLTDTGRLSGRNGSVRSVGSCPRRHRPDAPGHLIRSRRRPQRRLSPRRAQELTTSRLQNKAPKGPRPRTVRAYALGSSAGPAAAVRSGSSPR